MCSSSNTMGYAISRGSMTVIEISIMILIFFFKQITPLISQSRHPFADFFPDAGGGSPNALRSVQQKLISSGKIEYFNSPDHDSTLVNVASGKGICLAPGFLNDHSGQFAWIPYDCRECFHCVLCTHKTDGRESLAALIKTLQKLYNDAVAFPL